MIENPINNLIFRKKRFKLRRYPKIVQCDARGQIVIPKDIRQELDIDEGSGFWMFSISDEGILLKKVVEPIITEDDPVVSKVIEKAHKISVRKENITKSIKKYAKKNKGNLEEI